MFVRVSVDDAVIIVPETRVTFASGRVMVRVVELAMPEMSKVIFFVAVVLSAKTGVEMVGVVRVLLVSVCVAARPTKLSLCSAELNSAREPVRVLVSRSMDLFVSVCACAMNDSSSLPVSRGKVMVRSAVSSETAKMYWWFDEVSLI